MMKDNKRKLDELIEKVLKQMQKRKYGKKISSHYRFSFSHLKSISGDIGDDHLSQKHIECFLDSPIECSEKWEEKELTQRMRCPLSYIQQMLGHENISTTSRFYAFVTLNTLAKAIEKANPDRENTERS